MDLFLLGLSLKLCCGVQCIVCCAVCSTPFSVQYAIKCSIHHRVCSTMSKIPRYSMGFIGVHCTAHYTIYYTLHSVLHTVHQSLQYTLYISVTTKHILLAEKDWRSVELFLLGSSLQVCCSVQCIVCCAVCSTPCGVRYTI